MADSDSDLVQIQSPSGARFTVARAAAPAFSGLLTDLEGRGYKIDPGQSGGYNVRNIAGTNTPSQHSFGRAIDINSVRNARGANTTSDLPPDIGDLAAAHGLTWGGSWKGDTRDPMHFELSGQPKGRQVASADDDGVWKSLGQQPNAPAAKPEAGAPAQDADAAWSTLGSKAPAGGSTATTTTPPEPQSLIGTIGSSFVRGGHQAIDVPAEAMASGFDKVAGLLGYKTTQGEQTAAGDVAAQKAYEANPQNAGLIPAGARLAGNVAATLGPARVVGSLASGLVGRGVTMAAPYVSRGVNALAQYLPGVAGGAAGGAEVSAQTGEPIGQGAALGGALGAAIPMLGQAGNALLGSRNPAVRSAVEEHGIPLRMGQTSDSKIVRTLDDMTARESSNVSQRTAVTTDAARSMGITPEVATANNLPVGKITPQHMAFAQKMNGGVMNYVEKSTTISDIKGLATDLSQIAQDASRTPSVYADLKPHIKDVVDAIDRNGGKLPGDVYGKLVAHGSPLDVATRSDNSTLRGYATQVKEVLQDAMQASATPENAAAYRQARLQYKNMMTLAPLVNKGIPGEISPLLLQGAANRSFTGNAFRGAGQLGNLGDVAQQFLRSPPQSGTEPREFVRGALGSLYGDVKGLAKFLTAQTVGRVAQGAYLGRNPLQPFAGPTPGNIGYALPAAVDIRNQLIPPS